MIMSWCVKQISDSTASLKNPQTDYSEFKRCLFSATNQLLKIVKFQLTYYKNQQHQKHKEI